MGAKRFRAATGLLIPPASEWAFFRHVHRLSRSYSLRPFLYAYNSRSSNLHISIRLGNLFIVIAPTEPAWTIMLAYDKETKTIDNKLRYSKKRGSKMFPFQHNYQPICLNA